ncbi:PREDICTED: defensin-like protein 222 [Camelina sativa]|uniref:Defensin-like protein 222 n=1 Tax=Camelina sativa TaxID=90675 RepID=A0ABM0UT41_CAMSA|nr:PREDICTED: defensin-like protein 222 [Camelina sativa]XP_010445893.1 PREDICTED: defensin-like protein 222 [Camelina sativa]
MKTIVIVLTLLFLVLSCNAPNIKAKAYLEENTHSFNSATSPQINFKIDELPPDEHLGVSAAKNILGFCQECAHHCLRRKRIIGECRRFVCHCSRQEIGVWIHCTSRKRISPTPPHLGT